ncbi:F0F1-type ATP synthase assembly protein I [Bradyrhizobium sp. GM7.3]
MYFLSACLIVVVLSAALSYRRSRALSRHPQGRLAAFLPAFCAAAFALVLLEFDRIQGKQEVGPFATTYLLMLVVSFFGGWFLGIIVGLPDDKSHD